MWLAVLFMLSFSASAAVQAAKDRPVEGCSLLDISCQVKNVTERASSAASAASDWASDTASRAADRASDFARSAREQRVTAGS